ncbi:MAG: hypothetical protein KGY67_04730 [Candidatus Thermoplasmatota archaeon]|nr:hypothetical protein [Candidatus Thermoplasmatota archaeon]
MPQCSMILMLLFASLLLILFGSLVGAQESDASVESSIDINIVDGTTLSVELTADVSYITLPANDIRYFKTDIQQASPEMLGAIKYALKSDIVSQLKSSFPECLVSSVYELPRYESGVFLDRYNVSLRPAFFSMNESVSSSDVINGLLDSGVFVNYSFSWNAMNGWNNTFTLILSNELGYKRTDGSVDNKEISWDVFNGMGSNEEQMGSITLKDMNPSTDPSKNESVSLLFSLDCRTPNQSDMAVLLQAYRLEMKRYSCLPSVLSLPQSLPADAVRLCAENNLTDYEEIKTMSFDEYVTYSLNALQKSSFNQSFNYSFTFDAATTINCSPAFNVTNMEEQPPVTGLITDSFVKVSLFNVSARAFFGLINAGGESEVSSESVNFADVFDNSRYPSSSTLRLPDHVLFNDQNEVTWNHSSDFSGVFNSDESLEYSSQQVNCNYEIDVKSTDLNLLSFFTGKTEVNLGIGFEKNREIQVLSRSSELSIPEDIDLSFVNADAFRLCVEERVFTDEEINDFIIKHETLLENTSRRLFPSIKGSAANDQDTFEDSLEWTGNISSMDAEDPVVLRQCMESTAPLSCQFKLFPPQFSFEAQNLTFVGVAEETVMYNMTFPKGVSVSVLSSSQEVKMLTDSDGRDLLSVRLNASENGKVASVLLLMKPSLLYIIGLFIPCIISVIITFILFIVVYIIRKKRNTFRQNYHHGSAGDEPEEYENEAYYVPPKPPSKR